MFRALPLLLLLAATPAFAEPGSARPAEDTLLLALDGVPLRVVEEARRGGAFQGWSLPAPLVSTFPSTTHVAFTALFEPFGVGPADGYELRYFSKERNEMVGGAPVHYQDQAYAWKQLIDIKRRTLWEKLLVYVMPKRTARNEVRAISRQLLAEPRALTLAHVGSTDALQHIRGDEAALRFLIRLDGMLGELKQRYRERHGRTLRVVLYSDHGNGDERVRNVRGVKRMLRRAGFRVRKRLREPGDVVAPRFGIVSYGALFLADATRSRSAAEAAVAHPGIEVAAWRSAPDRIEVVSADGSATVRWRDSGTRRVLAYEVVTGDPLRLAATVERMAAAGLLDDAGFAPRRAWLRETIDADFPDGPGRLVTALAGNHVKSRATVLLSLRPGYAWGLRAAHVAARLQGGRVRGTHGGLDSKSSVGFWLADDPALSRDSVYQAERALSGFAAARPAEVAAAAQ